MRLTFALLAAALVTACGGSEPEPQMRRTAQAAPDPRMPPSPSSSAPLPTLPAVPAPTPAPTPAGTAASLANDPYPSIAPGEHGPIWGNLPLEVILDPSVCATVGTPMRAVIKTEPGSRIGGSIRYADGKPHDEFTYGDAVTGEWVWNWTVKPSVPTGEARVQVVGIHKPTGRSGAAQAAFEVKERC